MRGIFQSRGPLVCLFHFSFFFFSRSGKARGEIEEISGVIWMLKVISGCLMLALFGRLSCFSLSAHPPELPPFHHQSLCHDCLVFALLASEHRQLTLMKLLHLLVRVGL